MAAGKPAVKAAVDRAVAYLAGAQRPDGGFDSFSSPSAATFKKAFTYQTTFVPAVMLGALSGVKGPGASRLKSRLAGYVRRQAGPAWSFNYWAEGSPEREHQPYPDDLDDTCCALAGLVLHDPSLVGADALAGFVKILLATEVKVGGPYRTWLVPPDSPPAWRDVDLAVNANVAFVLSLVGEPLPNLTAYLERAIAGGKLSSPYYPSAYPLVYYLARAYRGPLESRLLALARQLGGRKLTPLNNAFLLSSMLRLGAEDTEPLVASLLKSQRVDGSWPAGAFCLDPARGGRKYYNGCESLTTALAVEALQLSLSRPGAAAAEGRRERDLDAPGQRQSVFASARRDCRGLEPDLAEGVLVWLEKLADSSAGPEIIGLPRAFYRSLKKPAVKLSSKDITRLALANLYGWSAYTVFDDFIDEEGQPAALPAATLSLRRSIDGFKSVVPEDKEFHGLVRQTFDTIDSANAWELAHCRRRWRGQRLTVGKLPDYGDLSKLADRSLGHSLPPLAVLRRAGIALNDPLFTGVRQAFKHYLIARQLSDDLHDWQTDLKNGHITYVVARVLSDAGLTGTYTWRQFLPRAQKQFWHESLPEICQTVYRQTTLSRQALKNLPLKEPNVMTRLLDKIEASTSEALDTQAEAATFLKQYKGKA